MTGHDSVAWVGVVVVDSVQLSVAVVPPVALVVVVHRPTTSFYRFKIDICFEFNNYFH